MVFEEHFFPPVAWIFFGLTARGPAVAAAALWNCLATSYFNVVKISYIELQLHKFERYYTSILSL